MYNDVSLVDIYTWLFIISISRQVLEVLSAVRGDKMQELADRAYQNSMQVFFPDG